jgi:F-type H+-transporting ATPase subunit alpha
MSEAVFDVKSLADEVSRAIAGLKDTGEDKTQGIVTRVGDGVAWIYGLRDAGYSEMLEIEGVGGKRITAFALNLLEDEIGAVLLGDDQEVAAGARVSMSGQTLSIPVGPELVGRVIDPLGRPLDGKGDIKTKITRAVESIPWRCIFLALSSLRACR